MTRTERRHADKARFELALQAYISTQGGDILEHEQACRTLIAVATSLKTTVEGTALEDARSWLEANKEAIEQARVHDALRVELPKKLALRLEDARAKVAAFAQQLTSGNPSYALAGSDRVFEAAASIEVLSKVQALIEEQPDDALLMQQLTYDLDAECRRRGRTIESSTSQTSNLMESHLRVTYAKTAEVLSMLDRGFIGFIA